VPPVQHPDPLPHVVLRPFTSSAPVLVTAAGEGTQRWLRGLAQAPLIFQQQTTSRGSDRPGQPHLPPFASSAGLFCKHRSWAMHCLFTHGNPFHSGPRGRFL